MPKTGVDLGADLYKLWISGTRYLPQIADGFSNAAQPWGQSSAHDGAFWRPAELGGAYGPAHAHLVDVRDALAKVLKDAQSNMLDAAHALKLSAEWYAETD